MTEASLVLRPLIATAFFVARRRPGRPNWFYGWDYQGTGHYPLPWGNGAPEYSPY